MERREFIKGVSAGIVGAGAASMGKSRPAEAAVATDRPNLLIVVSDEHRAGLTKLTGYPLDTSPTLDSLARQGVGFDRAYCTAPLCVPSRTSILTGRWPEAHRVRQNSQPNIAFFEKDIFDIAKSKGYKTGLIGKNHTYMTGDKHDVWRPFSETKGYMPPDAPQVYGEYEQWLQDLGLHGVSKVATPFPLEAQFPYRIISQTIDFLDGIDGDNFALEISFPEPHNPIQVPKPYFDMFPPDQVPPQGAGIEALAKKDYRWKWSRGLQLDTYPDVDEHWRRYKSNYLGMLKLLDDQLARLIDYLKRKNLYENTIIVYLADHGDFLMDYGLEGKGVGVSEALMRIPMVWSGGPIRARAPRHTACVSNADIMPTFCEAVGAEIPHGVQGRSLWPLLQNQDYSKEEFRSIYGGAGFGGLYYDATDHVPYSDAQMAVGIGAPHRGAVPPGVPKTYDSLNSVGQSGYMKMVRMDNWKLVYDMMGYGELYDLSADPFELNNLFNSPSARASQMALLQEMLTWAIRTQDSLPTGQYKNKWPEDHNWYAPYRRPGPEH